MYRHPTRDPAHHPQHYTAPLRSGLLLPWALIRWSVSHSSAGHLLWKIGFLQPFTPPRLNWVWLPTGQNLSLSTHAYLITLSWRRRFEWGRSDNWKAVAVYGQVRTGFPSVKSSLFHRWQWLISFPLVAKRYSSILLASFKTAGNFSFQDLVLNGSIVNHEWKTPCMVRG